MNFCGKSEIFDFVDAPTSGRLGLSETKIEESSDVYDAKISQLLPFLSELFARIQLLITHLHEISSFYILSIFLRKGHPPSLNLAKSLLLLNAFLV
ncbi:hypothetical protein ETT51_04435 [Streptococcus pyogenes]|uniref:Uncharacterized protein n=1 Tax=Streptococcus pyogenes TaxID=1314 RepID=A0A5S4TNH6_STRPY|nr:hypothetical protein M28_Spy0733 [Streptococcus pyogenes MGAS6180]AIG47463.1 hypothetical protein STAB902_06480 [Streptococcus pyogenes STAB902]AIL10855.1 hypothetical protein DP15_1803 [Streptococcus pyogenes]EZK69725.1 hypothetical protein Z477_01268 [Streptococcus pyogenes ABC020044412]EZK78638.1 hypothetical protein Z447_01283 [Streptococcus pyogenes ABC020025676]EZK83534.1 hypothetical protein Z429_01268 [Streptococcus pyogenes ABC020015292]EZK93125.1 hypothetical protein Z423_01271 [